MNPAEASVIAITDCGSTTTKAILVERVDGCFRQTHRGEAPTTVEAPVEDVTVGVRAALRTLGESAGRRLIDERGELIRPARDGAGVDLYLSTSSAGGGLQLMVAGLVRRISAESAERAALGAGAIVADVVACDDERPLHEQIERVRRVRPDMVLLAGGVDCGAEQGVLEMAELLAAADPRPRFGAGFRLPVVFAGNERVRDRLREILGARVDLFQVDNVRPSIDVERLAAARERIHELFLEHVMRQAPGFGRLVEWTDAPVMPTPSAVGEILGLAAGRRAIGVLCVDIGGATTDVFSVIGGAFHRTVSANLGVSYSAAFVLAEAGIEGVRGWLPFAIDDATLRDRVMNKTIRPTTIPEDLDDLLVEQALAREALRLSFEHHRRFATGLKGRAGERNIDLALGSGAGRERSLVDTRDIDLIIGSGGVLSHAPRPAQAAAMLIDAFVPEGITRIAKDSIFMMPHLGVLSGLLPEAAESVFERDCVVDLCTCVGPRGATRPGRPCLEVALERAGGTTDRERLAWGDLRRLALEPGQEARLVLEPVRGCDAGAGPGRTASRTVTGSALGVVLDCRGRPLAPPREPLARREANARWLRELGALDPEGGP
jgi:uncharacterized protein (TIGR01319 family)